MLVGFFFFFLERDNLIGFSVDEDSLLGLLIEFDSYPLFYLFDGDFISNVSL